MYKHRPGRYRPQMEHRRHGCLRGHRIIVTRTRHVTTDVDIDSILDGCAPGETRLVFLSDPDANQ